MGKFEDIIREKLAQQEVPYDAAQWDKLEARMNGNPVSPGWKKPLTYGGIAAAVLVTGTLLLMNPAENNSTETTVTARNEAGTELNTAENTVTYTQKGNHTTAIETENVSAENTSNGESVPVQQTQGEEHVNHTKQVDQRNTDQKNNIHLVDATDHNPVNLNPNAQHIPQDNTPVPVTPVMNVSRTTICMGESISLRASNADNQYDVIWDMGNGEYSRVSKLEYTYKHDGEFVITLRYHDKKNNKLVSKEVSQVVKVNPAPKVDFSWEESDVDGIPTIKFINLTDNAVKWDWSFGDNKQSADKQPDHVFNKKGTYPVKLQASNEYGCKGYKDQSVQVKEDFNLLAPNAFTPNGDGLNDVFIPEALKIMDRPFKMTIYDQRGQLLFQTSRADNPWDGRNNLTGQLCTSGAYVWVVTVTQSNGQQDVYNGSVTIPW